MIVCALAVVLRRPGLLVVVTPMLVAAACGAASRPFSTPTVRQWLDHQTLREGEATTYHALIDGTTDGIETVAAVLEPRRWIELRPEHGQVAVTTGDDVGTHSLSIIVRSTRWGNYTVGRALVVASSSWGAYRWFAPQGGPTPHLAVLPGASEDAARTAATAASPGLVGSHRSPRYGSGSEFATIRPFTTGDRLHRIRWPQSLRKGTLQVAATWADQDRHVVLVVDAVVDVGRSTGIDGTASSLDITVRAAAAIAAHQVGRGDRVSLVTVGSRRFHRVPPATGGRHLQRILMTLASIQPAGVLLGPDQIPKRLGRGSLVIMLSALRTPWALTRAVEMTAHGLLVVVVDCLPPDLEQRSASNAYESAAWKIERLRREHQIRRAADMGIAVVPWRGSAALEAVTRDLYRRRHRRPGWSA